MIKKISVLIPNRNTLGYLKLAVRSLRENASFKGHEVIVFDDASTDGSWEWLKENKEKYDLVIHRNEGPERIGIVGAFKKLVKNAKHDLIYMGHSDMYYAPGWDEGLLKHWKENVSVSSTRVEPPLYAPQACKIHFDCGRKAEDFDEEKFLDFFKNYKPKKEVTNGIFAPTLVSKEVYMKWPHDDLFAPQSREDSSIFCTWVKNGIKIIQSWDSMVYHFSGKGSRRKGNEQDSTEWQQTEYKNIRNFIRKWGTTPLHDEYMQPIIHEKKEKSLVMLIGDKDLDKIFTRLEELEPFFEDIVLVCDGNKDKVREIVLEYCKKIEALVPTNFDRKKFNLIERNLDRFDNQRNAGNKAAKCDWVVHIDPDEIWGIDLLNSLNVLISKAESKNIDVIGISRVNMLDGVIVNDIPREIWGDPKKLQEFKKLKKIKNPDLQFRIMKKSVQWVFPVHEVPRPIVERKNVMRFNSYSILHKKDTKTQSKQDKFYSKMGSGLSKNKTRNIVFNSVLYTHEGITRHAREEALGLKKRGWNVWATQPYHSGFGEEMKKLYDVFDHRKPHIYYVNQPPVRPGLPQSSLQGNLGRKNLVYYVAFEGSRLSKSWAKPISDQRIKVIMTPSEYCKKVFEKDVKNRIEVVPHGFDPNVFYYKKGKEDFKDVFVFSTVGTVHNLRKGHDLLVKAFSEVFGNRKDVLLLLKTSKIYAPWMSVDKEIKRYIPGGLKPNIKFIDNFLEDRELAHLYRNSDVCVFPFRAEGFGIPILEAAACGTPVLATKATGPLDFLPKRMPGWIETEEELRPAPLRYGGDLIVYERAKWYEPDYESLKEKLLDAFVNHKKYKSRAITISKSLKKTHTWNKAVEKFEKVISSVPIDG